MIGYLIGNLAWKEPTQVIIDVNGIGYEVHISLNTYSQIKNEAKCKLFTYLHVKEDAQILYGFSHTAEKSIFLKLISISGVGPNTGMMICSSLSVNEIQSAIVEEDVTTIQKVKGIGAKTAQRIILELKDKIMKEGVEARIIGTSAHHSMKEEALSALVTLGINKNIAEKTISTIIKNNHEISLEELIKRALRRA